MLEKRIEELNANVIDNTKALMEHTKALNAMLSAAKTKPASDAAEKAEPKTSAKTSAKKDVKDEPETKAAPATISDDDLRAVFAKYMGSEDSAGYADRKETAKAVIAKNGGKKIIDIPADQRATAVQQINKLIETGKVNLMEDGDDL